MKSLMRNLNVDIFRVACAVNSKLSSVLRSSHVGVQYGIIVCMNDIVVSLYRILSRIQTIYQIPVALTRIEKW